MFKNVLEVFFSIFKIFYAKQTPPKMGYFNGAFDQSIICICIFFKYLK